MTDGETTRRLEIRTRSGQEAQGSERSGRCRNNEATSGGRRLAGVKGDILDLRPTLQQGKRWSLGDPNDQHEILWLLRKKRPTLVIGSGMCTLFCTVLYHEQIRGGAWFLHDLSGDASQLSLPCMIRFECRHGVFHAPGDARNRRDGGRVSFLTNSPHIARRVEGSKRRQTRSANKLATSVTHPPSCTWRVDHRPGPSTGLPKK